MALGRKIIPLLLGVLALGTAVAKAADVATARQEMLDSMLTRDQPHTISNTRWVCAMGREPASVAESRADGAYYYPDAADSCVTALIRTARDQHLPELYGRVLIELVGSGEGADAFPRMIGATVLRGTTRVSIGQGKMAVVTPALAFDAGFTVAYQERAKPKAQAADPRQLKSVAEACLGQQQDAGTCFSAGYLYGVQAVSGKIASR